MKSLTNLILTAGPSITEKEINYVTDAAARGWNHLWAGYLNKFENSFAKYIGTNHALATSSCTGAMHLILKALGIKQGDEVIVPELTWIATASVVSYVGATPVFCDVDLESWTMLPESVEKLITPRTKVIMPVHLFGHPCDMEPLWALAHKHNLYIIEDAAQSIGATYFGKRTGSLGDAAAFSFQGAKAVVTGEGGILVTNNPEIRKNAFYFGDHGRDDKIPLYNTSIGYKYKMSNIQAALGLAQLERVDEIVKKKKQIFSWYQERLHHLDNIALNVEKKGVSNIFWMTSIVLSEQVKDSRDEFMQKLKEYSVDSRPIFRPLSSMPMFNQMDNPNAYFVGSRGINLPSGHNLTEEEVDYVCQAVDKILNSSSKLSNYSIIPKGWLNYREQSLANIHLLKHEGIQVPFKHNDQSFYLKALTLKDVDDKESISRLTFWRKQNQHGFFDVFNVTNESTQKWLKNMIENVQDRILFYICSKDGDYIGHVGLFRFDWQNRACEIDNIVRGEKNCFKGIMQAACQTLMDWSSQRFHLSNFYLKTFSNNPSAVSLYERLNFKEINRQAMYKECFENGSYSWKMLYEPDYKEVENYLITMKKSVL